MDASVLSNRFLGEDVEMIGDYLKKLVVGLGRFAWYHTTRIFRKPPQAKSIIQSKSDEFRKLNDEAGLDPALEAPVPWPLYRNDKPTGDLLTDPLYKMWLATSDGHKWSHYFGIYESVFKPRRTEALRILEIGVFRGSSLRLWRKYFSHPKSVIVGIDIRPECIQFDAPKEGIRVRIGSQHDALFLKQVCDEFGPFDLIIDDGSHQSSHMIASFNFLFPNGLKDSGIYFVEDTHANYWLPWRDSRRSFLDVCKELLEYMNAHYQLAPAQLFLSVKPSDQRLESLDVPKITTMIKEMRFFDSVVAIYKAKIEHMPYYLRGN
jgi:hypothetical protein